MNENDFFKKTIRLLIADDHEVVRSGLKRIFSIDKTFWVIDEAEDGKTAIEKTRYHKPDIVIMDIFMPRINGIEATKTIKTEMKDVLVVILTAFEDADHLENALSAGADGYLTKDISAKDLISSLYKIYEGERVFSKSIIQLVQKASYIYDTHDDLPITISRREQEVLNYVALGKTSPEISEVLNISVRTVQSHRSNIMQKLGIKTASSLVRYAVLNYDKKYSKPE